MLVCPLAVPSLTVIVTDREDWARRAKYLTTQAKDDPVEYIHHEIGYNHRLTNLQAAMGCAHGRPYSSMAPSWIVVYRQNSVAARSPS